MKNTNKITLCALLAALAVVLMLTAYFPYLTYAVPAFAGLCIMAVLIEIGPKWAFLSYITSAALTLILCEPEAMLMYVFLFGYYPILKVIIERIDKPFIEWPIKILVLNAVVIFVYSVVAKLFGVDMSDMGDFGKYSTVILLVLANIVFVVYDITVSKMSWFYIEKIHPHIKKLFK